MSKFKVGDIVHRTGKTREDQERDGMRWGGHYRVTSVSSDDPRWITVQGSSRQYHENFFTASYKTSLVTDDARAAPNALTVQHGGSHYKKLSIQPVEYIMANNIPYMEGNVIKYITRWKDKGGVQDLNKAKHYIEMLIENEEKNAKATK